MHFKPFWVILDTPILGWKWGVSPFWDIFWRLPLVASGVEGMDWTEVFKFRPQQISLMHKYLDTIIVLVNNAM